MESAKLFLQLQPLPVVSGPANMPRAGAYSGQARKGVSQLSCLDALQVCCGLFRAVAGRCLIVHVKQQ